MDQYHIPLLNHSLMIGMIVNQNSVEVMKQTYTYLHTYCYDAKILVVDRIRGNNQIRIIAHSDLITHMHRFVQFLVTL